MHDTVLAHGKAPFAGASRLEPFALKDAPALIEAVFQDLEVLETHGDAEERILSQRHKGTKKRRLRTEE